MGRCPGSRRRTQGTSRSISAVRIPLRRGAKSWKPMRMVSSSYERAHRHIILLWLTCSEDKMDTSSPIRMRHDSLSASCCVWFCLDTWLSPCHPCLDNINFCTHLSCIPGIWRSQMPRFCSHHISRAWDQDRLSISASPWVSAVSDRLASVRKLRVKSQHEYWDEVEAENMVRCNVTRQDKSHLWWSNNTIWTRVTVPILPLFSAWIEIPTRFNSRDNDGCAASMIRVSLFFSW